jgi:hypothetical protein
MLDRAVEHYEAVGRAQALADFTSRKPGFVDGDLYVACLGPDHTVSASAGFPEQVGASVASVKDADGKPISESWVAAAEKGNSTRYRWANPSSGKVEWKVTFVKKVHEDICGVGAYLP